MLNLRFIAFCTGLFAAATPAMARGYQVLAPYNLGLTYEASTSYASITYEADQTGDVIADDCETIGSDRMRCTAYLAPDGDDSPSVGLFLDTPFVRQGFFYFDYGFSLATVTYKGGIVPRPDSKPVRKATTTKTKAQPGPNDPPEQPITLAFLELYGFNWQGYVRFGVTPRYLPDLLIKAGVGLQTVGGRVKILKGDDTRYIAQPSAFAEAELVLIRAGTGSLSGFVGTDQSLLGTTGTKLIDDNPDGTDLEHFRVNLRLASAGLRLLFPF